MWKAPTKIAPIAPLSEPPQELVPSSGIIAPTYSIVKCEADGDEYVLGLRATLGLDSAYLEGVCNCHGPFTDLKTAMLAHIEENGWKALFDTMLESAKAARLSSEEVAANTALGPVDLK